ncbi:Putative alpha-L-arabinofuranosidase family protein [Zea mays]|uniref:non-reducing end alpha-L-arabinofuranosidase n=1 Tax=Zea mays TaxID=4577 RepID=A0A1D6QH20_MAIZE|nr:Putative alpha-L-arabinofuranosidase family protein [Zea mays]
MNDKLTNCGHQITIMEYAGFPFPTVALKVYTSDLTSLFLWTCPRCKGYTKGFEVIYRDHSTCGEGRHAGPTRIDKWKRMGITSNDAAPRAVLLRFLFLLCIGCKCLASEVEATQTATLAVDASPQLARKIPDTLFGIFFEEINHAGAGGIWAELVSNRGFEAGGLHTPSNIDPWSIIGDDSSVFVETDRTSCFSRNIVALRMEVLCDNCPTGGVGVYNPGFWGMNIEEGKVYNLVMFVKSPETTDLTVSLTSSNGLQNLASATVTVSGESNWIKVEQKLVAKGTNRTSRLQITTNKKGVVWFDQVSLMPEDTYKGHGFRTELISMILDLKPRFLRFPGGCFVEGGWLRNAFRWRESIGPWEERPGHFGDVWHYWTDDGLGYYEFLQLAEDLGTEPIWVFNNGVSHNDEVDTVAIAPFVKVCFDSIDVLDSIEFARGSANSTWGSVRAAMGHPEPFPVKYVAIGNEDCGKKFYRGNYLKFYNAIRQAYPDIQMISNCDGSSTPLDHPADLYDFHVYNDSKTLFNMKSTFDRTSRSGPKAFVSEYAVWRGDAGRGSLLASLAEAAFLTGLEKNSDIVSMASYAPLFVNDNDQTYWMQTLFRESSGAMFHPTTISSSYSGSLAASAITWQDSENSFLRVINFGSDAVTLTISTSGLQASINALGSTATVLTSADVMDENSFSNPTKVVPVKSDLSNAAEQMQVTLAPRSFSSFDLALAQSKLVAEM